MTPKCIEPVDASHTTAPTGTVTLRAFALGLLLAAGLAWLNCWIETLRNVHFLGGVQMPFGAVFGLLFIILAVNLPLRVLYRAAPVTRRVARPFSPVELLTIYSMLLFAALVSTPGCDNFFLTAGPTLFYFTTRENGWAALFYKHVPAWFAPGWDGLTFQKEVIERLYIGGLSFAQIPWHAWAVMLTAWSVFLLLVYATLFFLALLLRKQWIEHEALAFPLVELPLQMVDVGADEVPPGRAFWSNRLMWAGFFVAAFFHFLRGMNAHYPEWPTLAAFQGNRVTFTFTERPWDAVESIIAELYFGGVGVAYLLNREVSFSFWFFYLFQRFEMVAAATLGYPPAALPKDTYMGRPLFISHQSIGGWIMVALMLLWTAREHLRSVAIAAVTHNRMETEPFSPRVMLAGFCCSCGGLLLWSWFAGINLLIALTFFAIYLVASLVLARLVIEGGLLFPQLTFSSLEWMTNGFLGTAVIGDSNLTKLSFMQPMLMSDMRTNLLPGFLHTMKIAHSLRLDRRGLRRLLMSVVVAIVVSVAVTVVASLQTMYASGGLSGYTWFTYLGPQGVFNSTANTIKTQPAADPYNALWMVIGAAVVWLLTAARARFVWFPFHPLGYIVCCGYPMTRLWLSFFLGWAIKSMIMRYGGRSSYVSVRPFMIGLILGNVSAMVGWMIVGFFSGNQIPYWPA